jgi:hypothetical protein
MELVFKRREVKEGIIKRNYTHQLSRATDPQQYRRSNSNGRGGEEVGEEEGC